MESDEESESDSDESESSLSESDVVSVGLGDVVVEGWWGTLELVLLRATRLDGFELRGFLVGGRSDGSEREAEARFVADMARASDVISNVKRVILDL